MQRRVSLEPGSPKVRTVSSVEIPTQIERWGKNFLFEDRLDDGPFIVRLSDVDTNIALWQTGATTVFGRGMRNNAPTPVVSSLEPDVVVRYAAWYMVWSWRYAKGQLMTIDPKSEEPGPGFHIDASDDAAVQLRSPDGWTATFTGAGDRVKSAASFSRVVPFTAEQICDLGRLPEPFPLPI
jgi:hypothetical protein